MPSNDEWPRASLKKGRLAQPRQKLPSRPPGRPVSRHREGPPAMNGKLQQLQEGAASLIRRMGCAGEMVRYANGKNPAVARLQLGGLRALHRAARSSKGGG